MLLKRRLIYLATLPLVIALGLSLRSRLAAGLLSETLVEYGGDALWALLVFLGLRVLLPRPTLVAIAIGALLFAFGIEFSQLWRTPWLETLRGHRLGHLVLGSTFNWPDLPAYALGILLGCLAASAAEDRSRQSAPEV